MKWLAGRISEWGFDELTERTMREEHEAFAARAVEALAARPYGVPGASFVSWRGLPSGVARRWSRNYGRRRS
jgi:hypothetical protein